MLLRRQDRLQVVLALGIEAGMALGHLAPEQPVGADHLGAVLDEWLLPPRRGMVEDEEMVAERVVGVGIASR